VKMMDFELKNYTKLYLSDHGVRLGKSFLNWGLLHNFHIRSKSYVQITDEYACVEENVRE